MTLATPTHQQVYNGQGSWASKCSSRLKIAYSGRKGAPTKAGEWFLHLFALPRLTKAFLQPKQPACAIPWRVTPTHLSVSHLFVSPKSIFKTDCGQSCMTCTHLIKWLKESQRLLCRYHLQQLESKHILRKGKRFPGTSWSVCSACKSLSLRLAFLPNIATKLENWEKWTHRHVISPDLGNRWNTRCCHDIHSPCIIPGECDHKQS